MARFPLAMSTWDEREIAALHGVIDSDRYTMGAQVQRFERRFADHVGARHAVMVNSGSSANLLMIAALTFTSDAGRVLRRGDVVVVPAVSWSTTYAPLQQHGLRVRFVDVDEHTLNFDLDALDAAMTDDVRLVMAVNLLGNPNDFGEVRRLADRAGALLVEDNCESLGARYGGQQTGTFGLMGSYSGFFSHHISTMEGGVIVTDDDELLHLLLSLRAHGWTRDLPAENHLASPPVGDPMHDSFRFVLPGYNVRPLEMSGAVGLAQLDKLDGFIAGRRRNADAVRAAVGEHPLVQLQRETGESSWFGFSLLRRPDAPVTRAQLASALVEAGFEVRPIVAGDFTRTEVIEHFDHDPIGPLPGAARVHEDGLFIGNHHVPMDDAVMALRVCLDDLLGNAS
jgi:CDP-6-deoxy-D-xylo-4-hexulose-3-dehydrase